MLSTQCSYLARYILDNLVDKCERVSVGQEFVNLLRGKDGIDTGCEARNGRSSDAN